MSGYFEGYNVPQSWAVDVPRATAILDRFLHHSEIIQISGKSYRLGSRDKPPKDTKAPTGSMPDK
jgi:hypothetical protein